MKYLINWILSLFDKNNWKLGPRIFEEAAEYKLSGLTQTDYGLFIATSRHHNYRPPQQSRLYLNGQLIYQGGDETIGQGLVSGGNVFFAGENGNLLRWNGSVQKLRPLKYATALVDVNGIPAVIDNIDHRNRASVASTTTSFATSPDPAKA